MKETKNFFLKLFEGVDKFDYKVLNENWEKIDKYLDGLLNGGGASILPTMSVEKTDTGYKITMTDIKGTQTFELNNPKSPYQLAQEGGFAGTEEQFVACLSSLGIREFNLSEMGMPNIQLGADRMTFETDTTEIRNALNNGNVRFKFNLEYNGLVFSGVVLNFLQTGTSGIQQVCGTIPFMSFVFFCEFYISETSIACSIRELTMMIDSTMEEVLGDEPTSIDLSALDTQGKITETFADGTTKTTSIEVDENGNPTKIVDGDGNVTELIW